LKTLFGCLFFEVLQLSLSMPLLVKLHAFEFLHIDGG